MTPEERKAALEDLWRFVEEGGSCQCHTRPPCAYCERLPEELCSTPEGDRTARAFHLIDAHTAAIASVTDPATP